MVNKNLDLVEALTFADVHESYPEEEKEDIYDEIFLQKGFDSADRIILAGGPNQKEEQQRRDIFVQYMNEFSDREVLPRVQTTEEHQKELLEDERVDQSDYIFEKMDPDSSLDELKQASGRLESDENVVIVTGDYHTPRYEKRASQVFSSSWKDTTESWSAMFRELFFDEVDQEKATNDYLLLGAELDEDEFSSRYADKWRSEAERTVLPQKLKDIGKKYILN